VAAGGGGEIMVSSWRADGPGRDNVCGTAGISDQVSVRFRARRSAATSLIPVLSRACGTVCGACRICSMAWPMASVVVTCWGNSRFSSG
jgi:hypothetical protein